MKVCVINSLTPRNYSGRVQSCKNHNLLPQATVSPAFKGDIGQTIGSAAGIMVGIAATFVVGPLVAVAISTACMVGGAVVGNDIEEKISEK